MSDNGELYQDGRKTHGLKGVVVPSATNRDTSDDPKLDKVDQASLGSRFALHKAVAQNIVVVEVDEHGNTTEKRARLDEKSLEQLQIANRKNPGMTRPISYSEAINMTRPGSASNIEEGPLPRVKVAAPSQEVDPAPGEEVRPVDSPPKPRSRARARSRSKQAANPTVGEYTRLDSRNQPTRKKTLVRFVGSFGKVGMTYDDVFDTERFVVLIQRQDGDSFFEAPANMEDHIMIEWNNKAYWCLGSIQYTIPDGDNHTVFFIDPDKTDEKIHQPGQD